jgi:hypothetical protein
MRNFRSAPIAFFIPISFILLEALAVDKFMKLMQAIINKKIAITENNLTYSILPPDCMPFSYLPYRYVSEYGLTNKDQFGSLFFV